MIVNLVAVAVSVAVSVADAAAAGAVVAADAMSSFVSWRLLRGCTPGIIVQHRTTQHSTANACTHRAIDQVN